MAEVHDIIPMLVPDASDRADDDIAFHVLDQLASEDPGCACRLFDCQRFVEIDHAVS